eukprot:746715-Hanusia_phi.AAC.4
MSNTGSGLQGVPLTPPPNFLFILDITLSQTSSSCQSLPGREHPLKGRVLIHPSTGGFHMYPYFDAEITYPFATFTTMGVPSVELPVPHPLMLHQSDPPRRIH